MHHKILRTFAFCFLASSLFISSPAFAQNHSHSHSGVVKETMDAGGYTYLLVTSDGQDTWVAIPPTKVNVGETVQYIHGIQLENFASKTLNRTFENIVFSEGLESDTPKKAENHSDLFANAVKNEQSQESAQLEPSVGSSGAVTPLIAKNIAKATGENAYTVGELFTKRLELKDTRVRVHGKVVKVTPNIMGKNWIHIQDGSGDPIKNTHDLVITSSEMPKVGSVAVFEGKVTIDRDFGYSYQYDLLIEEAHSL